MSETRRKMLPVEKCDECKFMERIYLSCEYSHHPGLHEPIGTERECKASYTDETKTKHRVNPDWREIPDWCPLDDYPAD